MNLITEITFYEDVMIVESQLKIIKELFKKHNKSGITIQQILDKILHYPVGAVKDILAKIDFTKEYTDADIDSLLLTLKNKLDSLLHPAEAGRSLDDVLRNRNVEKIQAAGKRMNPSYLGM